MINLSYNSSAISAGDCVGDAWSLVQRNFGLYIGAGLVSLLLISCIPCANIFLFGPIMGGFSYIVLRDMRNEPVEFGMLFKGFEKFVPLMVIGLIQMIPAIVFQIFQWTTDLARVSMTSGRRNGDVSDPLAVGMAFGTLAVFFGYIIFQMIWQAALIFAVPLIIENDGISIGEAVRLSLSAVFANVGGLILLMIMGFLVGLLGLIAFCVGLLVAIPVMWVANVFAYRQVFPLLDRSFYTGPPPPSAYGSTFGQGIE